MGGGGRAEMRCKEHQVSAAVSLLPVQHPPQASVCAGLTADVP